MSTSPLCDLWSESTVVNIEEDVSWTYCIYTDSQGVEHRLRSQFFIGADGKTGYTHKHYLEPKGVIMERVHE